jgi:DNA-binding transcriptional regulator LsrR (DeoR family)
MKIIELYLKCWKKKDIACELGVSTTTVSHTLRDPFAQKIIKNIMKDSLQKCMMQFSPQK